MRQAAGFLLLIIFLFSVSLPSVARKVNTGRGVVKVATDEVERAALDTVKSAEAVTLSGYDKPLRSYYETLFVTSHMPDTVYRVSVTLNYKDVQGRKLHERTISLPIVLPPGDTRRLDFLSWDKQHSFYYKNGKPPRSLAVPYDVTVKLNHVLSTRKSHNQ